MEDLYFTHNDYSECANPRACHLSHIAWPSLDVAEQAEINDMIRAEEDAMDEMVNRGPGRWSWKVAH